MSAAASISLTDDLGRKVELKQPARRIVSLAPFLTELAFSAGAGDRVVGVSAFSDYPPQAKSLPQVSSAAGISIEQVAALQPDLVLAWADMTRPEDIARFERFGAAVFVARAHGLDDVPRVLDRIGALTGRDVRAASNRYRERIEGLRRAHAGREKLPVLLEIWHRPLTTLAGAHWMNEALDVCGARNAFADLPGVAPEVGWELVYQRDPPVIVGAGSGATEAQFRANWASRDTLAAVRRGHLVYVDPDLIERPTLRLADGVARLCEGLDRARSR